MEIFLMFIVFLQVFLGVSGDTFQANITAPRVVEAQRPYVRFFREPIAGPNPQAYLDSASPAFRMEIAQTPTERAKGLMNRTAMPQQQGMIFIFEDEERRTFWMKNTFIPLDMIFIGATGEVVTVLSDVPPCKDGAQQSDGADPKLSLAPEDKLAIVSCPLYSSTAPAQYVVELNAGMAKKYAIQQGNKMEFVR